MLPSLTAFYDCGERGQLRTIEQVQVQTSLKYPCDDNLNPHMLRGDDPFKVLERGIMRAALIVDVHNLYFECARKNPGKVVNFPALSSYFASLGNSLFHKYAFGRQPEEGIPQFAKMLRRNGFVLRFGSAPYNIDMALKVATLVELKAIDHLILGTSYYEASNICRYARSRGIYTTVVGFDVPSIFQDHAEVVEMPPEFLQDPSTT